MTDPLTTREIYDVLADVLSALESGRTDAAKWTLTGLHQYLECQHDEEDAYYDSPINMEESHGTH